MLKSCTAESCSCCTIRSFSNSSQFYRHSSEVKTYNADMDSTLPSLGKKRKIEEVEDSSGKTPKKVKIEELPGTFGSKRVKWTRAIHSGTVM